MKFFNWKIILPLVIILVIVAGILTLRSYSDNIITSLLKKYLPEHVALIYDELNSDILTGKVSIENINMDIYNKDGIGKYAQVDMDRLEIKGFSVWRFLFKRSVHVRELNMTDPVFKVYPYLKETQSDSLHRLPLELKKRMSLGVLSISNGQFFIMQEQGDSIYLSAMNIDISVSKVRTNADIIRNKIPLEYGSHMISATDIHADLGPYEKFKLGGFEIKDKLIRMDSLSLWSKYSRREMSAMLKEERPHLSVNVPSISMIEPDFGFHDSIFYIIIPSTSITKADVAVYIDRRIRDRTQKVNMYSEVLRTLPFDMTIDTLMIHDSRIDIESNIGQERVPYRVYFEELHASISQLSNTYPAGQTTKIHASALLMGSSPAILDWSFDMNDEKDIFKASGSLANFNSGSVKKFPMDNMIANADGMIDHLYFSIHGDDKRSVGEMQMKYENFSFQIFRDDRIRVNRFLTTIGNIFINDGSRSDEKGYRHGKISVERNQNRSFFNYLWLNVLNGLVNTMTGSGKKDAKRKK